MANQNIIVIGGGAAGLMAAGAAAERAGSVLLIEKMDQPGRKLRITGKGRCNLTNIASIDEFLTHFGPNGCFLQQAFSRFFSSDLRAFFEEIGVSTIVEQGGRIFPESGKAQDVVDALVRWNRKRGVSILTGSTVKKLLLEEKRIVGAVIKSSGSNQRIYDANAIIVATGGASYPATGSTGDGYRFAETVGHRVILTRPALVPLEAYGDIAPRLQGLSLKNVNVRIMVNGRKKAEAFGEMLFTHFGVSGPVILSLSGQVVDVLKKGERVELSIDMKPALDEKKLDLRILRDLDNHGKQKVQTILKGLLPRTLIPVCIELIGIDADKTGNQITAKERKKMRNWLKNFRLDISGYRSFKEAIITAGGVDLSEINSRTMESKLVKGLYFAGEVLNIDADTGGYNLQAAFSTGMLAGKSAGQRCLPN